MTLKEDVARPAASELMRFARKHIGYRAPEENVEAGIYGLPR